MKSLTASIVAAAALGFLAAPASADRAAMSVRAGSTHISLAFDDAPGGPGTSPAGAGESRPHSASLPPDPEPNPFIPDVHPSREEAARAAAANWARINPRRWERPPTRIRVMSDDQALIAPVQEGLRSRLGDVPVEPCDGTLCGDGTPPAAEAWLYVSLPRGGVSVRGKGSSDAIATAAYVEKPWVSNFADFVSRTPGRWVVARSDRDRPAATAAGAAQLARRAAAGEVVSLVAARMRDADRFDRNRLEWLVEAQLGGDRLVHDRFPQKFERPYGSLYHEAVLLDASDAKIDALARDVRRTLESERRAKLGGLAGAGAVLLVTYALYRFANAFTRGYFTWSLRTAAAVAAAGAVTLIVAVA